MPRGRRPQPTRLKVLRGNPGRRRLNLAEPAPAPPAGGSEVCPDWLLPEAKAEWARVMPELVRLGILSTLDTATLAGYCQEFAHWQSCERKVAEEGAVVVMRNDKGEVKWMQPSPYVSLAIKHLEKMRAFAIELGFTPAARSRVKGADKPAVPAGGKLAAFLRVAK